MRALILAILLMSAFNAQANNNAAVTMIVKTLILDEPYNLIQNGHFEFGDLRDWTAIFDKRYSKTSVTKQDHNYTAGFVDFDGRGYLSQKVALPKSAGRRSMKLSFDLKHVIGDIDVIIKGDNLRIVRGLFDADAGGKVVVAFDVDMFTDELRVSFVNAGEGQGVLTIDNVSLVVE